MKKIKYFNFTTNNTNRHEQQGNIITKVRGVFWVRGLFSLLCAVAVLFTGCFGFDERPEPGAAEFVAVESIHGVPTGGFPHVGIFLTATVIPEEATNKKIDWSIANNGGASAALEGNRLTVNSENDVNITVTATIKNGAAEGVDYTQDFHIFVSLITPFAVREIKGIPDALPVGQFTLNGAVYPSNAFNTAVLYSVKDAEATGASVSGDVLTTKTPGTVIITATVRDGLLENGDYTEDFSIVINKAVYVTGQNKINTDSQFYACYWIDDGTLSNFDGFIGKFYDLSVPALTTASYTSGVVFTNKPYIAGYYTGGGNNTVCYWVNGDRKELPDSTGATATTRSHSIASDGATVYITGIVGGTYCYWKIEENGTASKKTLTNPTGTVKTTGTGAYNGRFAAGGGRVYIPFQDTSNNSFYWDENGAVVPVTELNGVSSITGAMVMNNTLYLAGANTSGYPYYFALGDAASTALQTSTGSVNSIVKQNGALRFYGFNGTVPYSWSMTDGSPIYSYPLSGYVADTVNVAFSDGGVYIMQSATNVTYLHVLRGGNDSQTLIRGPKSGGSDNNQYTGIAVTQEN